MRKLSAAAFVACFIFSTASKQLLARCDDVFLPLDDGMQKPNNYTDRFDRDSSLYMLLGLMNPQTKVQDLDTTGWRIACDDLPPALIAPLRQTIGLDHTISQRAIRDIYEKNYLTTIAQRNHQSYIKDTLLEFAGVTHFHAWPLEMVPYSEVKRKSRAIYRSPEGFLPIISVSQTLDSKDGDINAEVLETEIAIKRDHSEDWDFYTYNKRGELSVYSTFPSGERPSPRICINCHYDEETRAVNRLLLR